MYWNCDVESHTIRIKLILYRDLFRRTRREQVSREAYENLYDLKRWAKRKRFDEKWKETLYMFLFSLFDKRKRREREREREKMLKIRIATKEKGKKERRNHRERELRFACDSMRRYHEISCVTLATFIIFLMVYGVRVYACTHTRAHGRQYHRKMCTRQVSDFGFVKVI